MKIFYSWQSDTPEKVGKQFIRIALDRAIEILARELEFDEAERPEVDQDTQGNLGSPAISDTILLKIREADVVVLDVTLTGETHDRKKLLNSNVGIELGYALRGGDESLLKVMNTHYGGTSALPFDLQHRRWPITYCLSPDAPTAVRRAERERLANELAKVLRLYLELGEKPSEANRVKSTLNKGSYWGLDEILAPRDGEELRAYPPGQSIVYVRVSPATALPELSGQQLADPEFASIEPLGSRGRGYNFERNRYGAISYIGSGDGELLASTQVFKNREIWGVESSLLRSKKREDDEFDYLPTVAFENVIRRALSIYSRVVSSRFGYPRNAQVEAGVIYVEGYRLALPNDVFESFSGRIFDEQIILSESLDLEDGEAVEGFCAAFFLRIWDSAGMARPDY